MANVLLMVLSTYSGLLSADLATPGLQMVTQAQCEAVIRLAEDVPPRKVMVTCISPDGGVTSSQQEGGNG